MSLSTILMPSDLCWARNPVVVRLRALDSGGNTFAAKGVSSTLASSSVGRFSNGATLIVDFEDSDGQLDSVTFTAVAAPTTETEIPDASFSGSSSAYWSAVADRVGGHHRIAPFFDVFSTGNLAGFQLVIRERTASTGWTVDFTAASFTITSVGTVTPDSTPENYRVHLEVFFEKTFEAGDWEKVAALESKPKTDGLVTWDISSVLDAHCRLSQAEMPVPDYSLSAPIRCDHLRRFQLRWAESFGAPITNQGWDHSSLLRVINGGVSQSRFAEGLDLAGVAAETGGWLTWMPEGRAIAPSGPAFLTWHNSTTAAKTIALEVQWRHRDTLALSAAQTFFSTSPLTVGAGESAIIPINSAVFGLDTNADAFEFQVRVFDTVAAVALTDWRKQAIDRTHYRNQNHLEFLTGLGTPETLWCRGLWAKTLEIDRTNAQRVLAVGFNPTASDSKQVAEKETVSLTYRTGAVTRGEANVLFDVLAGRDLWEVREAGYLPLRVVTKNFSITDSDRQIHAFLIETQPRIQMKNYSAAPVTVGETSGSWETPDSEWTDNNLISWNLPNG